MPTQSHQPTQRPASTSISALPDLTTYRVFISYKRGTDGAMAAALANALTRFGRTWYLPRAMRVFLDINSLAASVSLRQSIERALAESEWLIVLASPLSAASPWVRRELEWWLAHRPLSRLIIARTDGTIAWNAATNTDFDWQASTALSTALRGRYRQEPAWADLLAAAASPPLALRNPVFRDAFLNIAAEIHGVSKDALWNTERVEQRKRGAAAGVALLLVLAFGLVGYHQWTVSLDRKENLASIQLGAKAYQALATDPTLAAQIALAGIALRPSGVAAAALRSAVARLAGPTLPVVVANMPDALGLAFSADATQLALLQRDGAVDVIAANDGRSLRRLAAPPAMRAVAIAWARDGTLAIGGDAGLRLWPAGAGAPIDLASPGVRALGFSVDGRQLVLGHVDGSVSIGDAIASAGASLREALPAGTPVNAVAFNAEGDQLAIGDSLGGVRLWHIAKATVLRRFTLAGPVVSIDFKPPSSAAPTQRLLAMADATGAVQMIDIGAGEPGDAGASLTTQPLLIASTGSAGLAAGFVASGRCLVRAAAGGPVEVASTLVTERLATLASVPASSTGPAAPPLAIALAQTRHFAVLDAAGRVAVYDQPLCGEAEDVCDIAEPLLTEPMPLQARLRWLPEAVSIDGKVRQPPKLRCQALIKRVLGSPER